MNCNTLHTKYGEQHEPHLFLILLQYDKKAWPHLELPPLNYYSSWTKHISRYLHNQRSGV